MKGEWIEMRRKILIFISLILAFANSAALMTRDLVAAGVDYGNPNITICHARNDVKQPYGPSSITVDSDSIVKEHGHSSHDGPLATSESIAQILKDAHEDWGDIIPSFHYGHDHYFEGLNYNTTGQAMLANDCQYVSTVTPAAVSFIDSTCQVRNGSYIIPTTVGVKYYKGATLLTKGATYSVTSNQTITITAVADGTGYQFPAGATTSWSHEFVLKTDADCVLGDQSVTPAPVTFVNPNCDIDGSYTIPTTTGVKYYIGVNVVAAGTYDVTSDKTITVTAVADTGYSIKPGADYQWSNTFTFPTYEQCHPDKTVIPAEVTFVNPSCEANGSYTIPTKTGVKYYNGADLVTAGTYPITSNTTLTITAVADEGYVIDVEADSKWTHTFTFPTVEQCVQGATSVTPTAVTFTAPTCTVQGFYTVPTTTGVKYYVDDKVVTAGNHSVANGTTIKVTAIADLDYEIKAGATNQWTYTFTAPTNCGGQGQVLGTTITTLPVTSGDSSIATVTILSILAGIVVIITAIGRSLLTKRF